MWKLQRNIAIVNSRESFCQDPSQQIECPHNTRNIAGDAMRIQKQPEHSGHDLLPHTITREVYRAQRSLYVVFVDFTKAFDTVGRTGLWQLLRKYGCPEKFTRMIESLHTGMMAKVKEAGETSDSFPVSKWCKTRMCVGP